MNSPRTYVVVCSILLSQVLLSAARSLADENSREMPPNIVLIISDDQAWNDYSFMGHQYIRTPNIDRLASQGRTFTRGYVPSSLCCPSLASIITGLYPHQHLVTCNDPPDAAVGSDKVVQARVFEEGREVMSRHLEAVPTLPRMLDRAGYVSLQTGKWWQGNYRRGGFSHGMTRGARHGDDGLEIGRKTMQPIYDFIAEAKREGRPFFVWYAPMMPHTPHNPPEELVAKYLMDAPTPAVAKYWAMVEWFDATVGKLLAHLDQQELAENTIVVYLADNGWITNPTTGDFAAKSKTSQYDGGLRTPIIFRWPGRVNPEVHEELSSSIDIVPTLLNAVGEEPTKEMPGIDLLDDQAIARRTSIFGECFTHTAVDLTRPALNLRWRWTRAGKWKLIIPDANNLPNDGVELYDLESDEKEERNLASTHPNIVKSMRQQLDAWWAGKE